jgi:aspartate racemase
MRKLGLIGGMSWAATELYYRFINAEVQRRTDGSCSAPLVIESLNFCDLARIGDDAGWTNAATTLSAAARRLEASGATAILIGANSMHKVYDQVQEAVDVPILHIVNPVGRRMKADGIKTAALIGTRNVMAEPWFRQRLVAHGVSLLPADPARVDRIDQIIYEELMRGIVNKASQRDMKTFLTNYDQLEVDAVVLACTELGMIVDVDANVLPIYDTTRLHAMEGVDWIMSDTP